MPVDYSALALGQRISDRTFRLDAETVARYAEAVGDQCALRDPDDGVAYVPPMAIGALSLRGVIDDLAIPGGTLHVAQEIDFLGAVKVGETLKCEATLAQKSVRGGVRFVVVRMAVSDSTGCQVMKGKSTITIPV